jgi:hypothetical protein
MSIFDQWGMTPEQFTTLLDENPSVSQVGHAQ